MRLEGSEPGLSPVIGTLLLVAIVSTIAGVAWLMFDRVAKDNLSDDPVHVGFTTDSEAWRLQVVEVGQPLEWGVDLLVAGSCLPSLNGGAVSGPVRGGDVLACANAGDLRVTTSPDLGGSLVYRTAFE